MVTAATLISAEVQNSKLDKNGVPGSGGATAVPAQDFESIKLDCLKTISLISKPDASVISLLLQLNQVSELQLRVPSGPLEARSVPVALDFGHIPWRCLRACVQGLKEIGVKTLAPVDAEPALERLKVTVSCSGSCFVQGSAPALTYPNTMS
jgi:hypothetical protein